MEMPLLKKAALARCLPLPVAKMAPTPYKKHSHIILEDWATDILWWPVRLSREQQAEAMGSDSEVIEAEDFEIEEEEE